MSAVYFFAAKQHARTHQGYHMFAHLSLNQQRSSSRLNLRNSYKKTLYQLDESVDRWQSNR
jgi:hypothetical protein